MRTIIVNGDYLALKTFAGVARFAEETIKEIDRIISNIDDVEVIVFAPEYTEREAIFQNIKVVKRGKLSINLWKNITLPIFVKRRKGILLDFTQAFPMGIRMVTYIHDCIPEIYPNSYETKIKKYIRRPIKLLQRRIAARNCLKLMTLTQNSKKDILRFFPVLEDKVVVSYTGWEHIVNKKVDEKIFTKIEGLYRGNYCFTLGSRVWHKNLKWVIAAATQNPQYKFVISGDNSYLEGFDTLKDNMPHNVIFTGYISDGEVRALMANCKAFLFPTLYEGFGMPPIEALSTGVPIIISNASCLPEIYEDAAHYIEPLEYNNISIDEILRSPVTVPDKVLEKYSWEKTAQIVFDTVIKCFE